MHRRPGTDVRGPFESETSADDTFEDSVFLFDCFGKTTYICEKFVMYSLKEYPEEFKRSQSKGWLKFKKKLKKIAHTQLRRGDKRYLFRGREIPW